MINDELSDAIQGMRDASEYRREELEPSRLKYAVDMLTGLGFETHNDGQRIQFQHKGSSVHFYPYTGWHTGKTIKDGRGINNLLKQLKP